MQPHGVSVAAFFTSGSSRHSGRCPKVNMSKLKEVADTLDEIPEPLREYYVAGEDGKFRPDGIEDISALKRSLEHAKHERSEAKKLADKFKGIDLEEVARLRTEAEEREHEKNEKKGEWDKLKEQLVTKHKSDITEYENRLKAEVTVRDEKNKLLRTALETALIDAESARVLATPGTKGSVRLLQPHIRSQVKVIEEGNNYVARVVNDKGEIRIGDAEGKPMTIAGLVLEMHGMPEYAGAFDGSGASGSGALSGRGTPAGRDLTKLSPVERMNAARAQRK